MTDSTSQAERDIILIRGVFVSPISHKYWTRKKRFQLKCHQPPWTKKSCFSSATCNILVLFHLGLVGNVKDFAKSFADLMNLKCETRNELVTDVLRWSLTSQMLRFSP